jgi:hypothetical protein
LSGNIRLWHAFQPLEKLAFDFGIVVDILLVEVLFGREKKAFFAVCENDQFPREASSQSFLTSEPSVETSITFIQLI